MLISALLQQVTTLTQQVGMLTTRVQELEQRLNQNSQNSSKPPSSDPPSAPPRTQKTPRGRPRGGQPGHPGSSRQRREPDQIVSLFPELCPHCATTLDPSLPDAVCPRTTQVWELPPLQPVIIDYVQHTVCCPTCAALVTAPPNPDAATGYGARLTALIAHLHASYRLSDRATAALLKDLLDLPIGLASVVTCRQRVSQALAPVDAAIHAALERAPFLHIDETRWRESTRRPWLWLATNPHLTCVRIAPSRGRAGLDRLVPAHYTGIVISDRWNAYNRYPASQRQLCWAHLVRNVRALAEQNLPDSTWAVGLLSQIKQLFEVWQSYRDGAIEPAGLGQALQPIQQAIGSAIDDGLTRHWYKVVGLCQELKRWWEALWTFGHQAGVEPTNNAAERAIRPAVIWRKLCFGTQSAAGSQFVERMLSVVATCRQQGRPVWAFLTDAVRAAAAGLPPPTLLSPP